jgi:hypothetical protein
MRSGPPHSGARPSPVQLARRVSARSSKPQTAKRATKPQNKARENDEADVTTKLALDNEPDQIVSEVTRNHGDEVVRSAA